MGGGRAPRTFTICPATSDHLVMLSLSAPKSGVNFFSHILRALNYNKSVSRVSRLSLVHFPVRAVVL